MNRQFVSLASVLLLLPGCGSTSSDNAASPSGVQQATVFNPPPVADGYTRIVAPTEHGIPPGGDEQFCTYAMAPLDHDVDVMDVTGLQSPFGHHAVAFSTTAVQAVGSSMPCMGEGAAASDGGAASSLAMGAFLGGIGGESGGGATALPPGVAFRLNKGSGIMINVHFLNTGEDTIDGDTVLDFKFEPADPTRKVAAMFVNGDFGFSLPPKQHTDSTAECVIQSDIPLIMMSNHMHDYGVSASSKVTRVDGTVEDMHDDPTWSSDMQFNPVYTRWTVDNPFVLHKGDTLSTRCSWDNETSASVTFPREMCVGIGFAIADGANPVVPMCADGKWIPTH